MRKSPLVCLLVSALTAACATQPASPPSFRPPARDSVPNIASNPDSTFQGQSTVHQGCELPPPQAATGDIAYSGLVSLGNDRWVYVRDTKNCLKNTDLGNQIFGVVEKVSGQLAGTEVTLDLGHLGQRERPTDLEAICLASVGDSGDFELLAAESGGYDPRRSRRIFKFRFERSDDGYEASIAAGPVSYDKAVQEHPGAPHNFQAEAMLCSRSDDGRYQLMLGGRGRHLKRYGGDWQSGDGTERWVERKGGGLLPLIVDFESGGGASIDSGYGETYPEVVAKQCAIPDGWVVIEGEWRDVSDLHRVDSTVWAIATFEGEIGRRQPAVEKRNHYCSTIYRLCETSDCSDLWKAPPLRQVTGIEVPGKKVEGLTIGVGTNTFAIASDNESTGLIDSRFSPDCRDNRCDVPVLTFPRTRDLEHPVGLAQSFAGDNSVLVVFDVDDTLLTMQQDLGGNAWYTWQDQIKNGLRPAMADDGTIVGVQGSLLEVQGILYSLFDMMPTQETMTELAVAGLNRPSIATLALTARGPAFRDATHRELRGSGVEFPNAPSCTGELCRDRGVIDGKHVVAVAEAQLGTDAAELLKSRDIAIESGVMMVSGQDKGVMLRLLLANIDNGQNFDHIVFVDDDIKNVINVALQSAGLDPQTSVHPYHYTQIAEDAARVSRCGKRC